EEASPVEQGNGQNGVDGRIPRGALEARVVKRVIHHERLLVRLHPSDQAGAGAEKPLARRERSGPDQRLKRVISRVKQRNDPLFGAGCPCGASDDQLQTLLEASSATYGKRQLIQDRKLAFRSPGPDELQNPDVFPDQRRGVLSPGTNLHVHNGSVSK